MQKNIINRKNQLQSHFESTAAIQNDQNATALVVGSNLEGSAYALIEGKMNLKTKEVIKLLGSERLLQRLRHHKWLVPLYQSSDCIYPVGRVLHVQDRMERGELPPLLPCEVRQRMGGAQ